MTIAIESKIVHEFSNISNSTLLIHLKEKFRMIYGLTEKLWSINLNEKFYPLQETVKRSDLKSQLIIELETTINFMKEEGMASNYGHELLLEKLEKIQMTKELDLINNPILGNLLANLLVVFSSLDKL